MKKVKVIILRAAGTNCDIETAFAFHAAGAEVELVHINALTNRKSFLSKYHILAIPGGFTYGDDIASGKVLANELRFNLKKQLFQFIGDGKLIIGICNGFQVLVKMGLLPGIGSPTEAFGARGPSYVGAASGREPDFNIEATLSLNDSGKFEDRWVYLKGQGSRVKGQDKCVWTKGLPEIIYLPVAHGEGKFIPKDKKVLKTLKENGQIVFRYTDGDGKPSVYPDNPNGSVDDIAGICDRQGLVMGMMPHPERHITYLQHPNWRRSAPEKKEMGIGLEIFKNGVKFARNSL